jgi:predicted TIM-barrel fold metal-dependent hydrolase
MIDVHVHVTNAKLPGIIAEHPLLDGPEPPLASLLKSEMDRAGITQILAMGRLEAPRSDPLGIAGIRRLISFVPGLHAIGAIDPTRNSPAHFRAVESVLKEGAVKALKIYLGYIHLPPDSPSYAPYYELAATYKIPVVFHTGDPYSRKAKVRFAHPLLVDDVAVDNPDVRFVLAHFGNPWLIDAAEVVYKNDNVWADLSGLIIGDEALFEGHFAARKPVPEITSAIPQVRDAIRYTGRPDRFLYGSDWPLAPMASYRKLVEAIVPPESRKAIFLDNARDLFGLA